MTRLGLGPGYILVFLYLILGSFVSATDGGAQPDLKQPAQEDSGGPRGARTASFASRKVSA